MSGLQVDWGQAPRTTPTLRVVGGAEASRAPLQESFTPPHGGTVILKGWTPEQMTRIPEADQPRHAFRFGPLWVAVEFREP